jgi:mono-ADP-ribosyltransferase sirtuin 6
MLCLGSSMRVAPANQIPINMTWNGGKYVIVNLQKTPLDEMADMVIHGRIQTVMAKVMEKL